tara:strand:- start:296 stop:499 length:204 start_codon:yes stop_codon:yes gene_type:complete
MARTFAQREDGEIEETGSISERKEKRTAKLMRVTEVDQRYNTPAYKRFMEGDPSYFYKETKKKKGKV